MSGRRVLTLSQFRGWVIFCPACRKGHMIVSGRGPVGGEERPSFAGTHFHEEFGEEGVSRHCRFRITKGRITYLDGCTHLSVGQTVDLPEI